jgi:hypothetical protein
MWPCTFNVASLHDSNKHTSLSRAEDNLPSEKALYTGFARRVAEEAAASQAASQAAEEVQGFDGAIHHTCPALGFQLAASGCCLYACVTP